MGQRYHGLISKLLTVLLSTVAPISAAAQTWGRVGAVNVDASGTPPGGLTRELEIGGTLVHKERIRTSDEGSTQVVFPDQSTMNVGRNSDIVIDEFVYDPSAGTGRMVASATKGVFRYVGGKISHTAGVTVKTPVATVGIRGGVVTLILSMPDCLPATDPSVRSHAGQECIIAHHGAITVANQIGSVVVRPGFAVLVGANQPIGRPFRPASTVLQQVMARIASKPGQHGGVSTAQIPTRFTSLPHGFGQTRLDPPMRPPGSDPLGYVSIFGGADSSAQSQSQDSAEGSPPSYP
jgi:hypothetical protein